MNISILGCGWLGLPLAKSLLKKGHSVKGSTTSSEKLKLLSLEGIEAFRITVSPGGITGDINGFLAETDLLIVDIPPGLRRDPEKNFVGGIELLAKAIDAAAIKKLIFVSSTSVYEDTIEIPEYTEADEPNGISPAAIQLKKAEDLLMNRGLNTCILRFGGLIGADRHPVKYLAGKKGLSDASAPVNLIHQKDCIGVILRLIEARNTAGVFNAVYPEHPSKKEYYSSKARKAGLPLPEFDEVKPSKGKIVRSVRVGEELGYEFKAGIKLRNF